MIIVSNTTPLSELAKVGQLNLLLELFGRIIIPQEVYNEVTTGNHPAVAAVQSAEWIDVFTIQAPEKLLQLQSKFKLDLGESATIILAEELKANRVLIDERLSFNMNLPSADSASIMIWKIFTPMSELCNRWSCCDCCQ